MKRVVLIALAIFIGVFSAAASGVQNADSLLTLKGVVKDARTKKRISNVNVSVAGMDIGTVTNEDGFFTLKISKNDVGRKLLFSRIGYSNGTRDCEAFVGTDNAPTVFLSMVSRMLGEVTVFGGDARTLVRDALKKIDDNYPLSPNMLDVFYRETIKKGSRYVSVSEGVMDVYKEGYKNRRVDGDRVRIKRGRKLLNQKPEDTLAVKIQGGPMLSLYLDIVKNGEVYLNEESLWLYSFKYEHLEMIDDRMHYVVSFKPAEKIEYPLYSGSLYIDIQNLSLTRAELSLDVSDADKANKMVLLKKPSGLRFRCKELSFVVSYRQHGERWCLDYIRNTIKFKCDWKRRLFSSAYVAVAEMVVVDVDDNAETKIPRAEAYSNQRLFSDEAKQNWEADFWADYNIIEPSESLEKAVKKIKKNRVEKK
ncbi:MAG: carboxypeptidase-like regulatory domain-containing protein [Muribaculaceae bacterium]